MRSIKAAVLGLLGQSGNLTAILTAIKLRIALFAIGSLKREVFLVPVIRSQQTAEKPASEALKLLRV